MPMRWGRRMVSRRHDPVGARPNRFIQDQGLSLRSALLPPRQGGMLLHRRQQCLTLSGFAGDLGGIGPRGPTAGQCCGTNKKEPLHGVRERAPGGGWRSS